MRPFRWSIEATTINPKTKERTTVVIPSSTRKSRMVRHLADLRTTRAARNERNTIYRVGNKIASTVHAFHPHGVRAMGGDA